MQLLTPSRRLDMIVLRINEVTHMSTYTEIKMMSINYNYQFLYLATIVTELLEALLLT